MAKTQVRTKIGLAGVRLPMPSKPPKRETPKSVYKRRGKHRLREESDR